MIQDLENLCNEALTSLQSCTDANSVEQWRIAYLSRQGKLPTLLELMKNVPKEERPAVGKLSNEVKQALLNTFEEKKAAFETSVDMGNVDLTMPGRPFPLGAVHPVQQTLDRIVSIFRRMGFALADGPDIETEFHNFDALNTPPDHPARNEQDTFYVDFPPHQKFGRLLLRTQTSTVQVRAMQKQKPPIYILAPGRCYRRDEIDATHGVIFHQFEGLAIDKGLTLSDMMGTLEFFFKGLFGQNAEVRFRPHFFPFTEPSFEADCRIPGRKIKSKEWLELGGCGMVDPAVLEASGIDPEVYTGYAFGMGIERYAMLLHDIPDLRLFLENDQRFLSQFA